MRYPKEFWLLFLLLDRCYTHCQEDDLGGLLGALNPGIFADGPPAEGGTGCVHPVSKQAHRANEETKPAFINFISVSPGML